MTTQVPAYLSRGSGPTAVVFLHGVGGGKGAFPRQLEALAARGYRAVSWDMPGYGGTPAVEPYTIGELARSLERLIDALAPKKCAIVGHSMGGMVAQEAYALFSQKIQGLVLSGTSPAFGKPGGAWQQSFLQARLGPLDAGKTMPELAERLVQGMLGESPDPEGVRIALALMSAVPSATYRAALSALMGFDRRALLPEIAVPTLTVAGERDTNAPPAVLEKMAEKISGASYQCIAGAGHLANLERPSEFNDVLLSFLKSRDL